MSQNDIDKFIQFEGSTKEFLSEAAITNAAQLADEFRDIFTRVFKRSAISSKLSTSIGKIITIAFTLGADKSEYPSNIAMNDPMHSKLMIQFDRGAIDDSDNFTGPITMEQVVGRGIYMGSREDSFKVPFRKTTGDSSKLIKAFGVFVGRLYDAVKANEAEIQARYPDVDVASKL